MNWFSLNIVSDWQVILFALLGLFFSATGFCFLFVPEWLVTLSAWSNKVLFFDYIPMTHRGKSALVLFATSLLMFWLALLLRSA